MIIGIIGMMIRIRGLNHVGGDMVECLIPWYDSIAPTNGIYSLRNYTGNYGMPYVTILWLLHFIPGKTHLKIKAVSIIFEYICACSVGLLASHFYESNKKYIAFLFGFGLTIVYPVLIMNGAWTGQCDGIYSAFAILAIYAFLKDKPALASIFLGCAFAFKFQAIFILPFIILLYFQRRRYSLLNFLLVPITIEILYIPAMIAGYSPLSPITIYLKQAEFYPQMYFYYPGLWCFFWRWSDYNLFHIPAIALVMGAYALMFVILLKRGKDLSDKNWIEAAFITALIGVYFLPAMHERYGIIAELLAIVYAIIHPKRSWTSLFLWGSITWTIIQPFIYGRFPEHKECAVGLLFIIIALISFLVFDLKTDKSETVSPEDVKYRFKFENISKIEHQFLCFMDKYAYIAVYLIVFSAFIYSGKSLISVTTPDYLSDISICDGNSHTTLYFLYVRVLNFLAYITGKNTYYFLALSSIGSTILATFSWCLISHRLEKESIISIPLSLILLPTTLFYSLIGKYQDGLCIILISIGIITLIKYCRPILSGVFFGIATALLPYHLILALGIICLYYMDTKKADSLPIIKVAISAFAIILLSVIIGPAIGINLSDSISSLFLSFKTNGAIFIPVCLLLNIAAYRNSRYIPALLLVGYAALINIGKYMYVVDERFYIAIPGLIILALISLFPFSQLIKRHGD